MSETEASRTTLSVNGIAMVRQRPSLMLMRILLKAAEATLGQGLDKLTRHGEETSQLLKRLGATRVDLSDPIFADQADKDPIWAATALAIRGQRKSAASGESRRAVICAVTAQWDIAGLSAEAILELVDRLRFETADDSGPTQEREELPAWASPEEHMRELMTQLHAPPPDDSAPQILFVARLIDEQLASAFREAFTAARQRAEQLAQATGFRLGKPSFINFTIGRSSTCGEQLIRRQRCMTLLNGFSYQLTEDEIVSESPRPAEFTVNVHVNYQLE